MLSSTSTAPNASAVSSAPDMVIATPSATITMPAGVTCIWPVAIF
ncbi:MAG: hypothetical protein SPG10_01350 [Enterocloster clostridioformis]|nr:hypothetical protein [Enterocloster clostridioformis]